jgi:hypothetical protein
MAGGKTTKCQIDQRRQFGVKNVTMEINFRMKINSLVSPKNTAVENFSKESQPILSPSPVELCTALQSKHLLPLRC